MADCIGTGVRLPPAPSLCFSRAYGYISQVFANIGIKVIGIAGGLFLFPVFSCRFVRLLLRMALRAVVAVNAGDRGLIEQFIGCVVSVVPAADGDAVTDPLAGRVLN